MTDQLIWEYGMTIEEKFSKGKIGYARYNFLVDKLNDWVRYYNKKMGYEQWGMNNEP